MMMMMKLMMAPSATKLSLIISATFMSMTHYPQTGTRKPAVPVSFTE